MRMTGGWDQSELLISVRHTGYDGAGCQGNGINRKVEEEQEEVEAREMR